LFQQRRIVIIGKFVNHAGQDKPGYEFFTAIFLFPDAGEVFKGE
jgi:hypothetical protein